MSGYYRAVSRNNSCSVSRMESGNLTSCRKEDLNLLLARPFRQELHILPEIVESISSQQFWDSAS